MLTCIYPPFIWAWVIASTGVVKIVESMNGTENEFTFSYIIGRDLVLYTGVACILNKCKLVVKSK
jgi:hypothetical protein